MAEQFSVRVSKNELGFCAGHFISYAGDQCERLHGHNYRVGVELIGNLDENHYVFDFIALKHVLQSITSDLDHRMLLPTKSQLIRVEASSSAVDVRYQNRRWEFPRDDCVLLPIENTTAELLARYIAERMRTELQTQHTYVPQCLSVEVEETPGQSATYTLRIANR